MQLNNKKQPNQKMAETPKQISLQRRCTLASKEGQKVQEKMLNITNY